MRKAILSGLVGLMGCGPAADYVSVNGVEYHWLGGGSEWSPAAITEREEAFVTTLAGIDGYTAAEGRRALRGAWVVISGDRIPCGSSTGYCNGLATPSSMAVRDLGCPRASALTHEMFHYIQANVKDFYDPNHTAPGWAEMDVVYPCTNLNL